ncbi:MAG: hypothetical protein HUJ90_07905, partial [Bacteroidales bacterium]|nr:hypothetical protein [Bacteroidales bacterium]
KPIDDNRIYKLATINFLLDGGDDSRVGSISENVTETDIFIRDAIIEQIKKITARGEVLDLHTDGRVKILN